MLDGQVGERRAKVGRSETGRRSNAPFPQVEVGCNPFKWGEERCFFFDVLNHGKKVRYVYYTRISYTYMTLFTWNKGILEILQYKVV